MDAISLRMPSSLRKAVREMSHEDKISMNQYLITAAAEKVSAQKAATYVQSRIARGSKVDIATLLAKVPDTAPEAYDAM